MPKIIKIRTSKEKEYEICSMYEDTIDRTSPALWFVTNLYFLLIKMRRCPKILAKDMAMEMLNKWEHKSIPSFLISLFETTTKKEQEKLLRGKTITSENLICWILLGGQKGGLLSQYVFDEGMPRDFKGKAPSLIDISDPKHIVTFGETALSDAALIHIVEHHKTVLAHIIEFPEGKWYCFYRTQRGLAGRESGSQGQHVHFISSAYSVDRNKLVDEFKQGKCPSNGFHVHFINNTKEYQTTDLFICDN